MSLQLKLAQAKKSTTILSKDPNCEFKNQSSQSPSSPSTAYSNKEEELSEFRQPFAADETATPGPAVPTFATSTSMAPTASLQISQNVRARVERIIEKPLRGKQALQVHKQNPKAPKLSFSPSFSYQQPQTHQLLSDTVSTLHGRRYTFGTSSARFPALVEAPSVRIYPTCNSTFICAKCRNLL